MIWRTAEHGIPSSTFYSALKRLRALACEFPDKATPVYEKQEVVPVNAADLPSTSTDQLHQVSDVVNPMMKKAFKATIRITMGGSTLELTNDADPMVVGPLLKVLKSSCKDGFCLLYKRLEKSQGDTFHFQRTRNASEVRTLTRQQFRWLPEGLSIDQPKAIHPTTEKHDS